MLFQRSVIEYKCQQCHSINVDPQWCLASLDVVVQIYLYNAPLCLLVTMRPIKNIFLYTALMLYLAAASHTSSAKEDNHEHLAELVKATGTQPRLSAYLVSFHGHAYNYTQHFQTIGRDLEVDNTTSFIWHDRANNYYVANLTDEWVDRIRRDPAVAVVEEYETWEMGTIDPAGYRGHDMPCDVFDAGDAITAGLDLTSTLASPIQEPKEEHLATLYKAEGKFPKPGEYTVLFYDDKDYNLKQHFEAIGRDLEADDSIDFRSYNDFKAYSVKGLTEEFVDKIRRDPAVESVEENEVIESFTIYPVPDRLVDLR